MLITALLIHGVTENDFRSLDLAFLMTIIYYRFLFEFVPGTEERQIM